MNSNRRNYYRLLHVQPEAPVEVIRASYRTLMGTLRQHPDLGGDHATAVLINEAYQVLSDPARRAAYDLELRQRTEAARRAAADLILRNCPLCGHALPPVIRHDTRCVTCHSPLSPPARAGSTARELFGRRGSARRERTEMATATLGWPAQTLTIRWRDLSSTGLSFYVGKRIQPKQVLRIVDASLEVVAVVVSCRAKGQLYTVHARLLTAMAL